MSCCCLLSCPSPWAPSPSPCGVGACSPEPRCCRPSCPWSLSGEVVLPLEESMSAGGPAAESPQSSWVGGCPLPQWRPRLPRLLSPGCLWAGLQWTQQLSPSPRRLFRPGTGHREPGAEGPTRWAACALWAGPGRGGLGTERWLGCRTAASWSRCHELSAILRPGRPRWRPVVTQPGTPRAPPPSSGPFTFCRRVFPHPQPPKC